MVFWISLSVVMFPFSFILFGLSLFSFWWAWSEVCQSCLYFQITSSWFYWLFSIFLKKSFISSLIFIPSFADFRFCLFFFFFLKKILFLAVLGLCCFVWAFSSCSKWMLLFSVVCGFLIVELLLLQNIDLGTWDSAVVAVHRLRSCGAWA